MSDGEKKEAIIQAATTLFLQQGMQKVSMSRIASEAPVSKATLYKYFDSKDSLFAACISAFCMDMFQTMEQLTLEKNEMEGTLEDIAFNFVELIFDEKALSLYRLIIAECSSFPELAEMVYEAVPKVGLQIMQNYLDSVNKLGIFNVQDTLFAAESFFNLLKGERHFQCLLGVKASPTKEEKQQMIDKVIKVYKQGFLYVAK
jgi:TetR/AcrR family transcriptional repressor of mexJK operon